MRRCPRPLVLVAACDISAVFIRIFSGRVSHRPSSHSTESESDFKNMLRFGMVNPPYLPGIPLSALTRARIARIIWGDQAQVLPLQNATLLAQGA